MPLKGYRTIAERDEIPRARGEVNVAAPPAPPLNGEALKAPFVPWEKHTTEDKRRAEMLKKTQRVPLQLVCSAGVAHEAQAMREGFMKYGYASYLSPGVKMTMLDCIGAAERHLQKLKSGVDYDPSGTHHAGHARAMLGILLECMEAGKLVDDRHSAHKAEPFIERMFDRMAADNAEQK